MSKSSDYYTVKGYERVHKGVITWAMEDYLEMIYRFECEGRTVRVKRLSDALNVTPSAVTKMANQLKKAGYLKNEKYEELILTEQGQQLGKFLLFRHNTIHRFLCFINGTENELEETEKVEHSFSQRTVQNLQIFLDQYSENQLL